MLKKRTFLILLFSPFVIWIGLTVYFSMMPNPEPGVKENLESADEKPVAESIRAEEVKKFTNLLQVGFQSPSDLVDWGKHEFQGKAEYEIAEDQSGDYVLTAESTGTSVAYFKEVNVDMDKRPQLSWEWRVTDFPSGKTNKKLASKSDNDFGARVYAVFKGLTYFTSDTIQYVWDDHFPEGENRASPFAKRVKFLVIESGPLESADQWVKESRDIVADYEMLYGKKPKRPLHAVGIMSDSDNTKSYSRAQYKNMWIQVPKNR